MAQPKPEVTKSQSIRDYLKQYPKTPVKEVVSALAEKGVTVTDNHVYGIKAKMEAKKEQKREAKTAPSSNGSISKAPSKSSAIRSVLKENRKLTAKEVVSALAEKGISVTEGLVYFVKGQMKGKRGRNKASQVVVTAAVVSANGDALKTILKVKSWASEVGGMTKLKALVDALSE